MFLKFFATSINKEFDMQYVKGEGIRSYSGTPCISVFSPNAGKYGPE